jgi:hypothetical protein
LRRVCISSLETDLNNSPNLFSKNPTKMKSEETKVQMAAGIKKIQILKITVTQIIIRSMKILTKFLKKFNAKNINDSIIEF